MIADYIQFFLKSKKFLAFCIAIFSIAILNAQNITGTQLATLLPVSKDSTTTKSDIDSLLKNKYPTSQKILSKHPYFNFHDAAQKPQYIERQKPAGKELFFYSLVGILLLFAVLRSFFPGYFSSLIGLFFRTTLKQGQLRQQLVQDELPALLFNIFFIIIFAYYAAFFITEFLHPPISFWRLSAISFGIMSVIYLAKYALLKSAGWLLNMKTVTNEYIFIIFYVNKIVAIFLLPAIICIVLGNNWLKEIVWTLSWIVLGAIFLYRFIMAARMSQKIVGSALFHFVLYVIALEVLPLLLIYKAITVFLK